MKQSKLLTKILPVLLCAAMLFSAVSFCAFSMENFGAAGADASSDSPAEADETTTKVQYYLTGQSNGAWASSTTPYIIKLAKLADGGTTTATGVNTVESGGVYAIFATTNNRVMHVSDDSVNRCGATIPSVGGTYTNSACGTAHAFTITAMNGGYSIQSQSTSKYIAINETSVSVSEEAYELKIEAVEGNDGAFYIYYEKEVAIEDLPGEAEVAEEGRGADPAGSLPEASGRKRVIYSELKGNDELPEANDGTYHIIYAADSTNQACVLYYVNTQNNTNHCMPGSLDDEKHTISPTTAYDVTTQLWSLIKVESTVKDHENNAYLIKSAQSTDSAPRYLSATTNTNSVNVGETPYVFHIESEPNQHSGYAYRIYTVDTKGQNKKYLSFNDSGTRGWVLKDEAETNYCVRIFGATLADAELANVKFSGKGSKAPMSKEDTTSSYFRIPALVTLPNGWIVAASDIRWKTTGDNPNNLDTIVSVSKDGGETWDWEVVNYYSDFAHNTGSNGNSSSFIDPALAVDKEGNVWMAVDSTGPKLGVGGANMGKNATGFDDKGRILISKAEPGADASQAIEDYTYYLDLNGEPVEAENAWGETVDVYPICYEDSGAEAATSYYADAYFNTYETDEESNIVPIYCAQVGSDCVTQDNLYYQTSIWRTYPTFFVMIRKGIVTNDGIDWQDPTYANIKNNTNEAFTGVAPGRGNSVILDDGTERLIFQIYDNDNGTEYVSTIYSDDGGKTWKRGNDANQVTGPGKSSESQIIKLPDGRLRMYSRGNNSPIGYTDSSDNGVTWGAYTQDKDLAYSGNCMVSFINADGVLVKDDDGTVYKNIVLGSYPHDANRQNGVIRIGYVDETKENMPVVWLNTTETRYSGHFQYSCLTQITNDGTFGLLYETDDTIGCAVLFDAFTIDEILDGYTFMAAEPEKVPSAPTKSDLDKLFGENNYVKINCTGDGKHEAKNYGWIDSGVETGTVTKDDDGVYTVDVTIKGAIYLAAYNGDTKDNTHKLEGEAEKTVTLKYNAEKSAWELNDAKAVPVEYNAKCDKTVQQITITLDANGGDLGDAEDKITVVDGGTIGNLPTPTRTGYTFDGWYAENDKAVKTGDSYSSEMGTKFTARWNSETAKTYKITLDAGEGKLPDDASAEITVTEGGKIGELPAPTREGYVFDGWFYDDKQVTKDTEYTFGKDITLTAKWTEVSEVKTYKITLDAGEGKLPDDASAEITVTEGEKIGELPTPTREGYVFDGWFYDDTQVTKDTEYTFGKDITLTAKWTEVSEVKTYKITLDAGEGKLPDDASAEIMATEGEKVGALPTPTREGYTFDGWFNGDDKVTADTIYDFGKDITLTAKWTKVSDPDDPDKPDDPDNPDNPDDPDNPDKPTPPVVKPSISFDTAGGNVLGNIEFTPGEPVGELPAANREGYTFLGWTDAEGNDITKETIFDESITLVAKWSANKYSVSFNAAGGSDVGAVEVTFDGKVGELPTPTREGYTFLGWYDENGNKVTADSIYKVSADSTLTAQWAKAGTVAGGESSPAILVVMLVVFLLADAAAVMYTLKKRNQR